MNTSPLQNSQRETLLQKRQRVRQYKKHINVLSSRNILLIIIGIFLVVGMNKLICAQSLGSLANTAISKGSGWNISNIPENYADTIAKNTYTGIVENKVNLPEVTLQLNDFEGHIGVYAKNLNTGKVFVYHSNDVFPAASTAKVLVSMAVYKYLYDKASLEEQTRYDEYIRLMMRVSDNETYAELLKEMHEREINPLNRVIKDLSLTNTMVSDLRAKEKYDYLSVTTPYDMSKVFEYIQNETYLGATKSVSLQEDLKNTIFFDEIPRYVPGTVLHKVGALDNNYSDVGIIDDGSRKILISIYTTTDFGETYASDTMADIAARLYTQLK